MRTVRIGWPVPVLLLVLAALAIFGLRGVPATAQSGPLAVTATLEPAVIRIGDATRLTVTVDHPAGGSVELPELERGRSVVVTDRTRESAALPGGSERTTLVVSLTSFEVGEHGLGLGDITFKGQDGTALPGAPLPNATLRVKSVLAGEDTPLRGAKGLVRWSAPVGRWGAIAAGLLLLVTTIVLGAHRVRSRRRRQPAPAAPVVSPAEKALSALAALRAQESPSQRRIEPYYRELSSIVRLFLEEQFLLKAPERTTEEFIREAALSGRLAPAHQALVQTFLEQCDLVKFARHVPPRDDLASAMTAAERVVREMSRPGGQSAGRDTGR